MEIQDCYAFSFFFMPVLSDLLWGNFMLLKWIENQQFEIHLEENPSTGYIWILEDKNQFEIVEDTFIPNSEAVGSPGIRKIILRISTSNLDICLSQKRPWSQHCLKTLKFSLEDFIGK